MWKFYSRRDHCSKEKICIYSCSALIFFRQRRSSSIQTRILRVMADNLSEDLIVEILVRLPIKSLLRFRSVCKPWFSLITSSTFINAHIDHNHHHNNSLLLVRSYKDLERKVGYTLCQDNETIDEIMKIDLPFATNNQFFRILGCVNGLVCLVDDIGRRTDQVILWNPVIRRSLALPSPNIALNYTIHRDLVYGFGCGRFTNNDYKIVRILSPNEKSNLPQGQPLVEIFRLRMGIWENLDAPASLPLLDSRQAYLNGTIHWLANGPSIVAFDVDAEVFREVKLPNALQRSSLDSLIVASWRNSLSVFEVQHVGDFCLWVMEEYGVESSWTRRFAVKSFGVPRWIRSHRKNGEVILVENGRRLVSFDPEINQIRDSGIQVPSTLRAFHMKPYMESLVLIDQDDAAPVLHLEKDIC